MKKSLLMSALALISLNSFADSSMPDVKSQLKVTANIDAGCDLSAANINFGVLQMPLASSQTSSADITVKCSKNATYNIGIAYNNQSSTGNKSYTFTTHTLDAKRQYIKLYENGRAISGNDIDVACNATLKGVWFGSQAIAELYGYSVATTYFSAPEICGFEGDDYRIKLDYVLKGNISGMLNGVTSGEQIKYHLEIPGSSEVWNTSTTYTAKATGDDEHIPMKAVILSSENPTHRMTPDTYTDSLQVVLTY